MLYELSLDRNGILYDPIPKQFDITRWQLVVLPYCVVKPRTVFHCVETRIQPNITMATTRYTILLVALLQMQLFGVYAAKEGIITDCTFERSKRHLTFQCSADETKNKLNDFVTKDEVKCNGLDVEIPFVRGVSFSNCQFSVLPPKLLSRIGLLRSLSAAGTGITTFTHADLPNQGYGNIIDLDLNHNNFETFDPAPLQFLENLQRLRLFNSNIKILKSFPSLPQLKMISLGENKIEHIHSEVFANLGNLEQLMLVGNELRSAELHFPQQNQLRAIDLSHNPFEVVRTNDFVNLRNVDQLLIKDGKVKGIESGAFAHLVNLRTLELTNNSISQFPVDTFKGLHRLNDLRLNYNALTSAALHIDEVNSLQILDLSNNAIDVLRVGDFVHMKNLLRLIVESSKIVNIELGTFSSLFNLQKLDLPRNRLIGIDFHLFAPSMPQLKRLNLEGNVLTELTDNIDQLFPALNVLQIASNDFNCTYLKQFMRTLKSESTIDAIYDNQKNDLFLPNIKGILCKHVLEQAPPAEPAVTTVADVKDEMASVKHGFHSGYNVSIFVLLLWISLTNLVICGAIVLFGKKVSV